MADELKDQRVVTMMSPSELEVIDDWMFKSRIRSRGEAIRRLCQLAIAYDENGERLLQSFWNVRQAVSTLNEVVRKFVTEPSRDDLVAVMNGRVTVIEKLIPLAELLEHLGLARGAARTEGKLEGIKVLDDLRSAIDRLERERLESEARAAETGTVPKKRKRALDLGEE